jgi:hypothetical protein
MRRKRVSLNVENQERKLYRTEEEVRRARQGVNLVPVTRAEWEAARTDDHRMCLPQDYQTEEDLKWFRDPDKREEFRRKYLTKEAE